MKDQQSITLDVKVTAGAKKEEIGEFMKDGTLKVGLRAKPIRGQANRALIELLAKVLGIKKDDIEIISGMRSNRKKIKLTSISEMELQSRLMGVIKDQEP